MNYKCLLAVPAFLLITGCQPGFLHPSVCPTVTIPVTDCHAGSAPRRKLTITVNTPQLQANPPRVCADAGMPIDIQIAPPNAGVTVITVPKDPADSWIHAGNGGNQNSMTIDVPANVKTEVDYEYLIIASNGKCLDPEFHVD